MQLIERGQQLWYIPVTAAEVPCAMTCKLVDKSYRLTFGYNEHGDYFTIDLELANSAGNIPLVFGEILHLGKPCFEAYSDERYPLPLLVPLCLTGDPVERITYDNFGTLVKLYMLDRPVPGGDDV